MRPEDYNYTFLCAKCQITHRGLPTAEHPEDVSRALGWWIIIAGAFMVFIVVLIVLKAIGAIQ